MATKKDKDPLKLEDAEGLGPASIRLINEEGIDDTVSLVCKSATWLKNVTAMERDRAKKIIKGIKINLIKEGIIPDDDISAKELLKYRSTLPRIKTGCDSIDKLLNGGIESECITEFFGENGAGKTQMAHVLSIQVQRLVKDGGLAEEGKDKPTVLFLDTEGTCRPERLCEIAVCKKYVKTDDEALEFLDQVIVRKCYSADDLHQKIQESMSQIKDMNIKLIILDSATALFRSEYVGRGEGYAKFGLINEMLHDLKAIAENFRIPIVFINQIYHSPEPDYGAEHDRPFGGNVLGHAIPYRIHLKKSGKKRVARIFKSPYNPNDDALYIITPSGIENYVAKEKKKE
ncbi:MAG: hypothetical protein O6761_07855 [Thaumarchaeota archaeon]|nr:hypothetical protein [Nitrososphaerota archaeon]